MEAYDKSRPQKASVLKSKLDVVWTVDDDIVLNQTAPTELTVWDRVQECWRVAAPLALPSGLSIEVSKTKLIMTADGRELQNTNWPSTVCQHLGNPVHCLVFIKIYNFSSMRYNEFMIHACGPQLRTTLFPALSYSKVLLMAL
jgi:hypothetical protein